MCTISRDDIARSSSKAITPVRMKVICETNMNVDQAIPSKLLIYAEPLCRTLTSVEVISDTPIINGVISKANNDVTL